MTRFRRTRLTLYADESVHESLGFVATAFIVSDRDLEGPVGEALRFAGLEPERDEFKSGAYMASNPAMQKARDSLLQLAGHIPKVALVFSPNRRRSQLGKECLRALESVLRRNGIRPDRVDAFFDEGIFSSAAQAEQIRSSRPFLQPLRFHPEQNSRVCLGIQVADAVAHSAAQIVREFLTGNPKSVKIGGPGTGYPGDAEAPLGWALLMTLRHSFFTRPVVGKGEPFDPETDPVIVGPEDDPVDAGINPELIGWGVQIGDDFSEDLRNAVQGTLGKIWLGCIH